MNPDYLQRIRKADVYNIAVKTPLEPAPILSAKLGNNILFKREDLQSVFSFKLRGASNKLATTPTADLERGVICSSAGNHAQGVALAAKRLGVPVQVVMPTGTASIKIDAVAALGAKVILHGDAYDDAHKKAVDLARQYDLTFIHPFDDPDVIAGQGTIAVEIFDQYADSIDAIFVPVGGGGLISGIALYAKAMFPDVQIIGVEPEESASMHAALAAGHPVTLDHVGIFADGVAVRTVGEETFRICREFVDEVVLVNTDEICAAIKSIFEDTRAVVEPAGALAVAGMRQQITNNNLRDKTLIAINSGANVNFDRLRHIAERSAIGEQREALFAVEIPERTGSFLAFSETIGKRNITEFNYRYVDTRSAHIFVGIELSSRTEERAEIVASLTAAGYSVSDLSDNEMAKLHVRHMVGGIASDIENERLYRFEFPERPGALVKFLKSVGNRWNVTLFHYRNHGSDYGRVLAGVQVPEPEWQEFNQHLDELGYPYWNESDNQAYALFLGSHEPGR